MPPSSVPSTLSSNAVSYTHLCRADVSKLRVLHSSDAHYLENMLEREISYEVAEKSVEALFAYIKSGAM